MTLYDEERNLTISPNIAGTRKALSASSPTRAATTVGHFQPSQSTSQRILAISPILSRIQQRSKYASDSAPSEYCIPKRELWALTKEGGRGRGSRAWKPDTVDASRGTKRKILSFDGLCASDVARVLVGSPTNCSEGRAADIQ